jgi:hypothetical protein
MISRRRLLEAGVVASTLYATPVALAFPPEPSTRGVVNIT